MATVIDPFQLVRQRRRQMSPQVNPNDPTSGQSSSPGQLAPGDTGKPQFQASSDNLGQLRANQIAQNRAVEANAAVVQQKNDQDYADSPITQANEASSRAASMDTYQANQNRRQMATRLGLDARTSSADISRFLGVDPGAKMASSVGLDARSSNIDGSTAGQNKETNDSAVQKVAQDQGAQQTAVDQAYQQGRGPVDPYTIARANMLRRYRRPGARPPLSAAGATGSVFGSGVGMGVSEPSLAY